MTSPNFISAIIPDPTIKLIPPLAFLWYLSAIFIISSLKSLKYSSCFLKLSNLSLYRFPSISIGAPNLKIEAKYFVFLFYEVNDFPNK